MGLNVRAAMALSMGFVGGMSWLLQGVAPAPAMQQSPLVGRERLAPEVAQPVEPLQDGLDVRATRARGFARPNAVEREVERQTPAVGLPVTQQVARGPEPSATLPALVYDVPVVPASGAERVARGDTEPAGEGIVLAGGAPEVVDMLAPETASAAEEPAVALPRYRVVTGDSLTRICRRQWNTTDGRVVRLLVELNPKLEDRKQRILVGEELILPDAATVVAVLGGQCSASEAVETLADAGRIDTVRPRWYTIQRNDSLTSIAKRVLKNERRWPEILELNRDLDPNKIFPGVRIKLPPAESVASI